MKILYHHRTRSKDGQNVHIVELTQALRARGHEIVMVGPAAVENEEFGAEAGMVARLKAGLPAWIYEIAEFGYGVFAYLRLRRACLAHRPDVLYERYNLFLPAGVWLKKRFGIPMLSEINAPLVEERARFDGLSLMTLARWSEAYVWRGADYALPVTDVLADHVRAAGVPENRIVVISNGIDPAVFRPDIDREEAKRRLGLGGRNILGFTGFIRPWHGLDRVIDFLAETEEGAGYHFLVVGDGPARDMLEELARGRGVADRVTFAGIVGRDEISRYVAAFDIALQPDVVPYASPLKMFEYMALGSAIVAPDTRNIREILTDGEDGVLFDPDSENGFREALARVCRDPAMCERIGRAALATIDRRGFTWAANAERVEKLFEKLLHGRG